MEIISSFREMNSPLRAFVNPYFYGFDYYHVQTDFEYADYNADLGNGWKFDTKAYTTRYWNKQNYQNGATISLTLAKPSGVDKLNGYRHAGDTATLSKTIADGESSAPAPGTIGPTRIAIRFPPTS